MSEFTSFRSIIELWPTRELCADETGATAATVSKWWQRDRIPDRWWTEVLSTDRARSAGLAAETLASLASRESLELRA